MNLGEAIRTLSKTDDAKRMAMAIVCTVVKVTGGTCLCSPIDGSADIEDVRLQAAANTSGMLITPSDKSVVVVQMINDVEGVVIMFSDIESIKFFDGDLGAFVDIGLLVDKLNNLENKVNDIVNKFATHVHTGVTTGVGSSGTTPTPVAGTLVLTTVDDIDNPKITQ